MYTALCPRAARNASERRGHLARAIEAQLVSIKSVDRIAYQKIGIGLKPSSTLNIASNSPGTTHTTLTTSLSASTQFWGPPCPQFAVARDARLPPDGRHAGRARGTVPSLRLHGLALPIPRRTGAMDAFRDALRTGGAFRDDLWNGVYQKHIEANASLKKLVHRSATKACFNS